MFQKILSIPLLSFIASTCLLCTAYGQSDQIDVKTEIKINSSEVGGLLFSPCKYDKNSSCAVVHKTEINKPLMKSGKQCTFLIANVNVAKIEVPKGGTRTLTVMNVGQDFDQVKSLVLEGAKYPIYLTCDGELFEDGIRSQKNRITITESVLRGFKEFGLGKVKHFKVPKPVEQKAPQRKAKPESQGSST